MAKHIKWSDEEIDLIAKKMADYLIKNPGESIPSAYNSVCEYLPKSRRRLIKSSANFDPSIITAVKLHMMPGTIKDVQLVEKVVHIPYKISDIPTDELQAELFRRQFEPAIEIITNKVVSRILNALPAIKANHQQYKSQAKNLRKILIVGLLPKQQNIIEKEFDEIFNLKFVKDNVAQIKSIAPNCDEIVLMTKFISHKHQDAVKSSGVIYSHCNGSVSELKDMLEASFYEKNLET